MGTDLSIEERLRMLETGHKLLVEQISEMVVSVRATEAGVLLSAGKISSLEAELAKNSETTGEVRDILASAKGAFKLFGWVNSFVKGMSVLIGWLTAIYVAIYMLTHNGRPPGV